MGTYLHVGIVKNVRVSKKDIPSRIGVDEITKALNKEINTNYYSCKQEEDFIYWKIKPHVLEDGFVDFLKKQLLLYNPNKESHFEETIDILKRIKTGEERLEVATKEQLHNFHDIGFYSYNILEVDDDFEDSVLVNYDLISFFSQGKIIVEGCREMFKYFEKNIRLQNQEFLAAQCLKVLIVG